MARKIGKLTKIEITFSHIRFYFAVKVKYTFLGFNLRGLTGIGIVVMISFIA